jgi:putative ABC transport system permease protein
VAGGFAKLPPMLVRGMRWRLMGSVLVVLTAAIAVGTAIVGPLYLQAGGDSLIRTAVATASEQQTGFTLAPENGHPATVAQLESERSALIRRAGARGVYARPIASVISGLDLTGFGGARYAATLAFRTGICAQVHLSAGRCALGPGDVVMSARSARALHASPGATITVTTVRGGHPVRLTLTGVFAVPDVQSDYWFGSGSSAFAFGHSSGKPQLLPELDDLFVSAATAQGVPAAYLPAITVQTPVRPGAVGVGNARHLAAALAAAKTHEAASGFSLGTGLPAVLATPLHQRRLMNTIVAVAAVQLALLAIWVLAAVLLRSADLRRSELRVARLRGFPLLSMLAVTVTEPAILCAIGTVLGVLAAWAGIVIATHTVFSAGTTVSLDVWVFAGFGAAVLTICGVLGLSAVRLLRGSGLGRTASADGSGSRARAVVDVAILVVSVVALIAAATSGALASRSDPIAAAAPAVIALGASVIAISVVEFLCRRAAARSVDSPRVAAFLAVRQIGRRPAALRESRTLVIALCLACFAVSAWSVARTNRSTAAVFSLGAPTVLTVTPHPGVALRSAVDRVDPAGHDAMAAVQLSGSTEQLLGVDAGRLPGIISWPDGVSRTSVTELSRRLAPAAAPQVNVGGASVSVSANAGASGPARAHLASLELSLWVFNPTEGTTIIDLGTVVPGAHTYRGSLGASCPGSCRLVGIGVLPRTGTFPTLGEVDLRLTALSSSATAGASGAGAGAGADLAAADWRSTTSNVGVSRAAGAGVGFVIDATAVVGDAGATGATTPAMASVADHPAVLPEVAGSAAEAVAQESGQAGQLNADGLDGSPVDVRPAVAATALPRLGPAGEMVDLTLLERAQTGPTSGQVTDEVWLSSGAPADTESRLRAAGLTIDGVQRTGQVIRQGAHSGPALAYTFLLLATIVALLAAAVSTFGVLAAGSRQRATELISLEVAGVPRRLLVRSLALEAAILSTTTLFGVGAGALGAAIAIPSLPQLGSATFAPLSDSLPVLLVLAVALAGVLVVLAATALAARGIVAAMSPTLLRSAAYDTD